MERVSMKVTVRDARGTIACRHLRRDGFIPGVVYKGGQEGTSIFVDKKDLRLALHSEGGEHAILNLDFYEGDKKTQTKTAIIHELQTDPLDDTIVHIDLHEISLTEIIKVKVPITVKGEAAGIEEGGILNQMKHEVEVECKAMDLPEHFEINVSELNINDSLHVKDLEVSPGVTILDDPESALVGVNPPQSEEEEVEEPAEEGEGEPEVIKKGKQDEEREGEASAEEAASEKEGGEE